MKQILTIGSALVDIFITSSEFVLTDSGTLTCSMANGKLDVESMQVKTGGGASNTAVGFARLGYATRLISELGNDEFAQLVAADFAAEHVDTQFLVRERREQTGGSVILVTDNGERMVLVHRGAASQLDPHDIPAEAFTNLDWVYLSSVAGQVATIKQIGEEMHQRGVHCTWNPGNKELAALVSGELAVEDLPVEIFMVNQEEWQQLGSLQEQYLASLSVVVVTDGVDGGTVYRRGEQLQRYTAATVEAVDVTGAGDAFGVGFTHAWLEGQPVAVAAEWGVRNAGSVVQQVGAKAGLLRGF
jgi:ribokinase